MNYSFDQIKSALITHTINCTLPSDMTELSEELLFGEIGMKAAKIANLGKYISESEDYESNDGAYFLLQEQSKRDGSVMADNVVCMWETLENTLTVDELLDLL